MSALAIFMIIFGMFFCLPVGIGHVFHAGSRE